MVISNLDGTSDLQNYSHLDHIVNNPSPHSCRWDPFFCTTKTREQKTLHKTGQINVLSCVRPTRFYRFPFVTDKNTSERKRKSSSTTLPRVFSSIFLIQLSFSMNGCSVWFAEAFFEFLTEMNFKNDSVVLFQNARSNTSIVTSIRRRKTVCPDTNGFRREKWNATRILSAVKLEQVTSCQISTDSPVLLRSH